MAKMIVKLEWDEEDLGEKWMNPDNLALLLYGTPSEGPISTKKELLKMTDVTDEVDAAWLHLTAFSAPYLNHAKDHIGRVIRE